MDLELTMWLEDEATSSEVTGDLVMKWMDPELISECCEWVLSLDVDLTYFLDEFTSTSSDILFHFFDQMSRDRFMPMSQFRRSRTREIGHRREVIDKITISSSHNTLFFANIWSLFAWNYLQFFQEALYSEELLSPADPRVAPRRGKRS